jgi:hypothetical protein
MRRADPYPFPMGCLALSTSAPRCNRAHFASRTMGETISRTSRSSRAVPTRCPPLGRLQDRKGPRGNFLGDIWPHPRHAGRLLGSRSRSPCTTSRGDGERASSRQVGACTAATEL